MAVDELDLNLAAEAGDVRKVRKALKKGVDVNAEAKGNRWTALHWAVYEHHKDVMQVLFDAGANPNAQGKQGISPLQLAVVDHERDMEIITMLLDAGADRNLPNEFGASPLEFAQQRPGFPLEVFDRPLA